MKKIFLLLGILIFFLISSLQAFEITSDNITFKPLIVNVNVFDYFDNGTTSNFDVPFLDVFLYIKSESVNPNMAKGYVKINDNITKPLEYYYKLSNVPPSYINKYLFVGKIIPQDFGFEFNYEGYLSMLDAIDNITIYGEYDNKTYSYTFSNFAAKYKDFLKIYNHSVKSIDTSYYPEVSWDYENDNASPDKVGISLYPGNDDEWNKNDIPHRYKVDDTKPVFAGWFNPEEMDKSINFLDIPNINIPNTHLIFKVKTDILASDNESNEGSSVMRFQAAFKKIPDNATLAITNLTGWHLMGTGKREIFVNEFNNIFDKNKVATIWSWQVNGWKIWSPDPNIMDLLSNYGLNVLKLVYPRHGYWVKFK